MKGKVVVVTGASAGLGRATVREFARSGAKVALLARGHDGLEAARREVEDLGGVALVLPTDVGNEEEVEDAAEQVEAKLGAIDVWVNNAMVSVFSPVHEMTPEEYRRVTEVTYLGSVFGTLAALKRMRPRDHGVIVQVGSALAYRSIPLQSAYCAAKHAISGFVEALRTELLHERSGVQVTQVHMPALNTPQFDWVRSRLPNRAQPVPPIFQPEVGARAIVYAAQHPRKEYRVGLSTAEAIVGEKLAPSLLDRFLARTGYASQQTDEPAPEHRRDNLWEPVPGDAGAHGRFDDRSRPWSPYAWLARHRATGMISAVALATAAAFGVRWALADQHRLL